MNNLVSMKNCPRGVQGNLNWMPGYFLIHNFSRRLCKHLMQNLCALSILYMSDSVMLYKVSQHI